MTDVVSGRLATVNRLVNDACARSHTTDVPEWWFSCAADAVANHDLDDADYVLEHIENKLTDQDALHPIREARQLVFALQEEWSV